MFQIRGLRKCGEAHVIANSVNRLFVYGTLRRGSSNEYALELAVASRFVGHGRIRGRLFRVTHYPALVAPANETDWVTGDLFENIGEELLQRLDHYEGPEYTRVIVEVMLDDGQQLEAYLYFYQLPVEHLELIPSGDWFHASAQSSQPE